MEYKDRDIQMINIINTWKNKIDINSINIKISLIIDSIRYIILNKCQIIHLISYLIKLIQIYIKIKNIKKICKDSNNNFNQNKILTNFNQVKIFNQIIRIQINFKILTRDYIFPKDNLFHRMLDFNKVYKSLMVNITSQINDNIIKFICLKFN